MGVARAQAARYRILVGLLTGLTLFTVILYLGATQRDHISHLVPTVSWENVVGQAETAQLPQCSGEGSIHELERKWGKAALRMSLAHGGSGARLHRALRRFKESKKIVIGVVGGSITVGHGLEKEDKKWPQLLEEGLKRVYPESVVEVRNGAVPATGTDYFSACYEHHIPKDSDLFIIETAVNDLVVENLGGDGPGGHQPDIVDYTERLVREMLSAPSDPAVLMLSTWIVPYDYVNGADRHAVVSEYYDLPRVSMRSFLYPYLAQHRDELPTFFGNKNMDHPVKGGHEYLADIMLYHLLQQDCVAEELHADEPYPDLRGTGLQGSLDAFAIPPLRIKQHLDQTPYSNPRPYCVSTNVRLEGNKAQLQPSAQSGWEETEWHGKHYWTSETPGARITFSDIEVHGGKVSLYYLRSGSLALGNMKCWANDAEDKAVKLQGFWQYVSVGSAGFIAEGLAPGKHSVTCMVMDEKEDHNGIAGTNRVSIIAVLAS